MAHTYSKSAKSHGPAIVNTKANVSAKSSLPEAVVHNVGPDRADMNPDKQKLNRVGGKGART